MRNLKATGQILQSNYNDIIRFRKYFGDNDTDVTSIIPATEFFLFKQGVGETDKNISTGAVVTLKEPDCSLFGQQGIIPNAESFTIMAIGVDLHLANVQGTTVFTDDSVTSIDVTPVSVVNPYPLFDAIRSQATFELWRNSTELLEQGNLADYPSGLSMNGWSGESEVVPAITQGISAGLQVTYTRNAVSVMQNGNGFRKLTVWQELASLDQFFGKLKFARQIDLANTALCGYIDVLLVGQANVDRKSNQFIQQFS